jgi:hypothetical protein
MPLASLETPTIWPVSLMLKAAVWGAPGTFMVLQLPPLNSKSWALSSVCEGAVVGSGEKVPTIWPAALIPGAFVNPAPGGSIVVKLPPLSRYPCTTPPAL